MAAHEEAGLPSPSGEVHEHLFFHPPTLTFGDGTLPPRRSNRGESVRSYGRHAPECARLDSTVVRFMIAERWGALIRVADGRTRC